MHLEILTPEKKVYSGEVTLVNLPGSDGSFEVLTNHAPIISALNKGVITIKGTEGEQKVTVDGGVVEVLNNTIIVLAEAVIA